MEKDRHIISHHWNVNSVETEVDKARERIIKEGDKAYVTVEKQLQLLHELQNFPLGRFLIQNHGLNGQWIDYILMYPCKGKLSGLSSDGKPLTQLEKNMLNNFPVVKATQQRFIIFRECTQRELKNDQVLASIPCGLMGEFLNLDFSGLKDFHLVGIDLDALAIVAAKKFAEEVGLTDKVEFIQRNAWQLAITDKFNLISSNGLNIYEPDDAKITELYRQFYQALIPGGLLITSFITPSPLLDENSCWKMDRIDKDVLLLQKIIFSDILQVQWQCARTVDLTRELLKSVGFKDIEFIYDEAHIFPTVTARK